MTGVGSSCGACKFLRRKCMSECVFAPYFCYDQAATHFAAVHKVFGASNVSKLLLNLPVHNRGEAAITISYEALARVRDPIYGCVAHIFALQLQVANLQEEIEILGNQMANFFTVGFPSCESSQPINHQNSRLQSSTQCDANSIQEYLYQQALPLSHTEITAADQDFNCQVNTQLPLLYGWGDQTILPDPNPTPLDRLLEGMAHDAESNSLERLLEGMDQQIFAWYPLLNNDGYIETYAGSS